jgi:hypothetical protein
LDLLNKLPFVEIIGDTICLEMNAAQQESECRQNVRQIPKSPARGSARRAMMISLAISHAFHPLASTGSSLEQIGGSLGWMINSSSWVRGKYIKSRSLSPK